MKEAIHAIETKLKGAHVYAKENMARPGHTHFVATIVWQGFEGEKLLARHRAVQEALSPFLADGRIHAVQLKTLTPKEHDPKT